MLHALGSPQIPFWGTPTSGERVEGQGNYSLVGLGEAQGLGWGICLGALRPPLGVRCPLFFKRVRIAQPCGFNKSLF